VRELALSFAAFACSVCGMGWLSLGLESHWVQVFGSAPRFASGARGLYLLGTMAHAGSLVLLMLVEEPSVAVVVWVMTLTASAFLIAVTLAYRPRVLAFLVAGLARPKVEAGASRGANRRPRGARGEPG